MSDALWWIPSLIVFGTAAVALTGVVVGARRLAVRREQRAVEASNRDEIAAKGRIVEADEAVREAEREIDYVEAGHGPTAAARYRAEVSRARAALREALLLQQKLDDATTDTTAQRRAWSARIGELCGRAVGILDRADASVAGLRAAERDAVHRLPELRSTLTRLVDRREAAVTLVDGLGTRYAPGALSGARDAIARADAALAAAGTASTAADADRLDVLVTRADRELAEAESTERALEAAEAAARDEADRLEDELAQARAEADGAGSAGTDAADPRLGAALDELGRAVADGSAALAEPDSMTGTADPSARRARLRSLRDRLGTARAEARRAGGRLDGARTALAGAIAIAEHAMAEASAVIDRGRARVGAEARTRLAEAERHLVVARQEPDPVAALDAARRAAARAADADALARYDVSH